MASGFPSLKKRIYYLRNSCFRTLYLRKGMFTLTCHLMVLVLVLVLVMVSLKAAMGFLKPHFPMLESRLVASYLDELSLFKGTGEKACLAGFSVDSWNIGQRKYKDFLAVNKMYKRIQKANIACVEVPMWEYVQGPHYDDRQHLLDSVWVPDMV